MILSIKNQFAYSLRSRTTSGTLSQALTKLDAHNKKLTNQLAPLQEQVASQQQEIERLQSLVNQLAAKAGIVAE